MHIAIDLTTYTMILRRIKTESLNVYHCNVKIKSLSNYAALLVHTLYYNIALT